MSHQSNNVLIVIYVYPERNDIFKELIACSSPHGTSHAASRTRLLAASGWQRARKDLERWKKDGSGEYRRSVPPPLKETGTEVTGRVQYKLNLQRDNSAHTGLIAFWEELGSLGKNAGFIRQVYMRHVLVRGMQSKGTLEFLKWLEEPTKAEE